MVLVLYIALFIAICFYRRFFLTGRDLKSEKHTDGRPYLVAKNYSGKRSTSVAVSLGLPVTGVQSFVIRREKWYHRFLKGLGLAEEISTGNAELDRTLYFVTETPQGFHALLEYPGVAGQIGDLFLKFKVKEIRCFGGKLWVRCPRMPTEQLQSNYYAPRLEAIGTIANAAEAAAEKSVMAGGGFMTPKIALAVMLVHAAFLGVGISGFFPTMLDNDVIVKKEDLAYFALSVAFVFTAGWFFLIVALFRGTSWIPLVLADFVIVGVAGYFLSAGFIARSVNITFDSTPPVYYSAALLDRKCSLHCSKSTGSGKRRRTKTENHSLSERQCQPSMRETVRDEKRRTSRICASSSSFRYTLVVDGWLDGQADLEYQTGVDVFDKTYRGQQMRIPSRSGAIGFDWVNTAEIEPK